MVTRKEWYQRVNDTWPATVPPLTAEEAVRAARKLYRFVRRRTWDGEVKVTSGNRYTWVKWGWFSARTGAHKGVITVNPERGWESLVHLLSHAFHGGPHGGKHAQLERRMIREVLKRGWLDGALKRAPTPPKVRDRKAERRARAQAAVERWERKLKLATTMLRKARRRMAYYTRAEPKEAAA